MYYRTVIINFESDRVPHTHCFEHSISQTMTDLNSHLWQDEISSELCIFSDLCLYHYSRHKCSQITLIPIWCLAKQFTRALRGDYNNSQFAIWPKWSPTRLYYLVVLFFEQKHVLRVLYSGTLVSPNSISMQELTNLFKIWISGMIENITFRNKTCCEVSNYHSTHDSMVSAFIKEGYRL